MKNYKKGFAGIIIVAIVALGILGFGAHKVFNKSVSAPVVAPNDTSDWKTYRNDEYSVEFKYPLHYKVEIKKHVSVTAINVSDSENYRWTLELFSSNDGQAEGLVSKKEMVPLVVNGKQYYRTSVLEKIALDDPHLSVCILTSSTIDPKIANDPRWTDLTKLDGHCDYHLKQGEHAFNLTYYTQDENLKAIDPKTLKDFDTISGTLKFAK